MNFQSGQNETNPYLVTSSRKFFDFLFESVYLKWPHRERRRSISLYVIIRVCPDLVNICHFGNFLKSLELQNLELAKFRFCFGHFLCSFMGKFSMANIEQITLPSGHTVYLPILSHFLMASTSIVSSDSFSSQSPLPLPWPPKVAPSMSLIID